MLNKVYILVGLPGSGKSTWAREKAKEPLTVIVNRDSIRTMLAGTYQNYNFKILEKRVKRLATHIVTDFALGGYNVIIDETNVDRESRGYWEKFIRCTCELNDKPLPEFIAVHFNVDAETCIARRQSDTKGTDDDWAGIVRSFVAKFEEIDEPYFSEVRVEGEPRWNL